MSDISTRLLQAINEKGFSYGELAKITGIPKSAIQRYATGETTKIPMDRLKLLAEALDTEASYLMGWSTEQEPETERDPVLLEFALQAVEEQRLIRLWRKADDRDKSTVMHVLGRYETEEAEKPKIYIRHYLVPAAAGYASAIEGEDYEWIELPEDAPRGADFCIQISGDSMEPYIRDGEMVYVKRGVELHDFEPGIFFVDGNVYCKQFCPGYAGEFYLLSANPKREDANIIVKRDQPYFYFGKVLTKLRLPRPLYY